MRKIGLMFLIVVLGASLILSGCSPEETKEEPVNDKEEEAVEEVNKDAELNDAEALIEARCESCHGLDQVYVEREENEWPDIVSSMIEKSEGLLDDEEYEIVVEYLQDNYSQ